MKRSEIKEVSKFLNPSFDSPDQITIIKIKGGSFLHGWFATRSPEEENDPDSNTWEFVKRNDKEKILVNGEDIVSIGLEENGKLIYYREANIEVNHLNRSAHEKTVKGYYQHKPNK